MSSWPVRPSQTFTVLSPLPVTIRVPSREKLTLLTGPECPFRSSRGVPVRASHTFAVWSKLPVRYPRPVGRETHALDLVRVPLQVEQGRAGARVPDPCRPAPTAGDDPRTVGGETQARDTKLNTNSRVRLQVEQGRAHARVPDLRRILPALRRRVQTAGEDPPPRQGRNSRP